MVLLYFKQAFNLIRQERLFSLIYIVGTGLSISVVMALVIVFYIRVADLYPETNRSRMLLMTCGETKPKSEGENWSNTFDGFSMQTVEACFRSLENAEAVSLICRPMGDEKYIESDTRQGRFLVMSKYVDQNFWEVFRFHFLSGKPFTGADVRSALPRVVISANLAHRLFGSIDVVGRECKLDYETFRIVGVVRDGSFALGRSYADIWIPYSCWPEATAYSDPSGILGIFQICALAPSLAKVEALKAEMAGRIRRYAQTFDQWEFNVYGQPDRPWQSTLRRNGGQRPDFGKIVFQYALLIGLLLFVPAVSLSGMADSRMERRLSEMGVRRAFGAQTGSIMGQVLIENLLFTLIGGFVGLLFSYGIVYFCRDWILQVGQWAILLPPAGTDIVFSPAMLINLSVFGWVVLVCLILNVLSAVIPAWRASRKEIIYSLNLK